MSASGRELGKIRTFLHPIAYECIKFNFLLSSSVGVSPPLHIVSRTEAAFIFK